MRVIDDDPACWILLQEDELLYLAVPEGRASSPTSVLVRLSPKEVARYRSEGRTFLSALASRIRDAGPGDARELSPALRDAALAAVERWHGEVGAHRWLAGTRWYVPDENLLAYLTDPALRVRTPVADQTLWSISSASGGRFQGTSTTQLWVRAPGGGVLPMRPERNALDGTITVDGDVTIVFTPEDPGQPRTTGYGHLRRVDGAWRMEMQMATGTQSLALHWAYMTQWTEEGSPPAPGGDVLDESLRSGEWRWLLGSAWSAVDEELFPDGATFGVDGYRNGYCWGDGAATGGSTLRLAGSVTPEGMLYLLLSVADAAAVPRRGRITGEGAGSRMTWSLPAGGPVLGGALAVGRGNG